eukprot:TRINITY_DN2954_c0_g1_i1.p1 TRINITY_DN2954_c0_g1~~TRINITY_DN2954_c0_g1_i1.p1  ORF type:complete len:236 (-),score=60.02 TRINITY_DN2954_c0_g1_i1:981-1640(-)
MLRESTRVLACALHPRLGSRSPAQVLSIEMLRYIATLSDFVVVRAWDKWDVDGLTVDDARATVTRRSSESCYPAALSAPFPATQPVECTVRVNQLGEGNTLSFGIGLPSFRLNYGNIVSSADCSLGVSFPVQQNAPRSRLACVWNSKEHDHADLPPLVKDSYLRLLYDPGVLRLTIEMVSPAKSSKVVGVLKVPEAVVRNISSLVVVATLSTDGELQIV